MERRVILALLAGGAPLLASALADAQNPSIPLIGFVRSSSLKGAETLVAAFRQGLRETGYVEGQNVAIEFRSAEDRYDALPGIIDELLRRPVAVLVVNGVTALFAKRATRTVPIVFAVGSDPVRQKLVARLSHPGDNLTGVTFFNSSLGAKKLELLRSVVPKARAIGVLENPEAEASHQEALDVLAAARVVGQRVTVLQAISERDFDTAVTTLAREHAGALLVTGDALFTSRREKLLALVTRQGLPTIHSETLFVQGGGLMSYGASITDAYRQVGVYTGRILSGEKPGDLPVMQPTKFELMINLKAAKALGVTIPPEVAARADEVIQ